VPQLTSWTDPTTRPADKRLDPELEKLLKDLTLRQTKELLDLKKSHERQIYGDPSHWLETQVLFTAERADRIHI